MEEQYEISTDRSRLDIDLVHEFLASSYWAKGIPRDLVEKSIRHSLCFGVYLAQQQVGFARVVTDFATFAYIADVFVVTEHRGRGASKQLMKAIMEHSDLQRLRQWVLATRDAHRLYAQFGFQPLPDPGRFMILPNYDVYRQ